MVAARLSEDENVTVLLLEAGPDDMDFYYSVIPAFGFDLHHTDFDWKYKTVPQEKCCGNLHNRVCPVGSGRS